MPVTDGNTYHGYTVTDYRNVETSRRRDVETDYGTLDDMRAYVKLAHELDIKVIVDLVLNHTSYQHPWFIESQNPKSSKANWYRWSSRDPNQRGPFGQQVWHLRAPGCRLARRARTHRRQPDDRPSPRRRLRVAATCLAGRVGDGFGASDAESIPKGVAQAQAGVAARPGCCWRRNAARATTNSVATATRPRFDRTW